MLRLAPRSVVCFCGLVLSLLMPVAAVAQRPQEIVAAFCREDGLGARTLASTFRRVAPLVKWPLEPAWDSVVLITGYKVGNAIEMEAGVVEIEVEYSVVGRLVQQRHEVETQTKLQRFRLQASDDGWWIVGPPVPPHVFVHRVDTEALGRALAGRSGYLSQSLFVAEMFRAAGWRVPTESVDALLAGTTYVPVPQAAVGDLAVYSDGDAPYHVAIVEEPDIVVSATLNAGIVRSTLATFPGRVRFLRLVEGVGRSTELPVTLEDEAAGTR